MRQECLDRVGRVIDRVRRSEQAAVGVDQDVGGTLVGGASDHCAVHAAGQMMFHVVKALQTAVDGNVEPGERPLHGVDKRIVERRNLAVLLRAQTLEPGLAGVDGEGSHAGRGHGAQEGGQNLVRHLVVHPDAALDRDGPGLGRDHRRADVGHAPGLAHEDSAETARLDPVGRAADVEVDRVVTVVGSDPRGFGEFCRIRSAELRHDRLFPGVVVQEMIRPPTHERGGRDHLGVEKRVPRQCPVERPAMPVGPVHHRRDGQPM